MSDSEQKDLRGAAALTSRTRVIRGRSLPGLIRNGEHYFTRLDVFADGVIDCWELIDLALFKQKLQQGWVALSVPEGGSISIIHLTALEIANGNWTFGIDDFYEYVVGLIREMNPNLQNLYQHHERKLDDVVYKEDSRGQVCREVPRYPNEWFPPLENGEDTFLFYRDGERYFLVRAALFPDGGVEISGLSEPYKLTFAELQILVKNKIVRTELEQGSMVEICGIGSFTAARQRWAISIEDKMLEAADLIEKANGRPTTGQICQQIYKEFLRDPTLELKEELKIAYEKIPSHMRAYIGDMDSRDSAVREIIYYTKDIDHEKIKRLREEEDDDD